MEFLKGISQGPFILVGGAEDRKYDKEVLKKILAIKNIKTIAVVPTATVYSRECGESYVDAFFDLGVRDTRIIDIRYKEDAEDERFLKDLTGVDLIYFTGGDQVRLVEILQNTSFLKRVKALNSEGVAIAGTSAGAAAMSKDMIFSWSDDDFLFTKGSVTFTEGFGLLQNAVVDTHFIERGRIPRLTNILAAGNASFGIGVAEDTAAVIYADQKLEVIGNGLVTLLQKEENFYTDYHEVKDVDSVTVEGIKLVFLGRGVVYDLERRMVLKKEKSISWQMPFISEPMFKVSLI